MGLTAKIIGVASVLAILPGCTSSVSDDVSLQAVASQNEGIVVLVGQTPSAWTHCGSVGMEIRRQDGSRWATEIIEIKNGSDINGVVQKKLKAGQYAVTNLVCHTVNRKILLQKTPDMFSPDRSHFKYGFFEVRRGEVVNLGQIFTVFGGLGGRSQLTVLPLTEEQRTWLAQNRPKLSGRMVTRLMQPVGTS